MIIGIWILCAYYFVGLIFAHVVILMLKGDIEVDGDNELKELQDMFGMVPKENRAKIYLIFYAAVSTFWLPQLLFGKWV